MLDNMFCGPKCTCCNCCEPAVTSGCATGGCGVDAPAAAPAPAVEEEEAPLPAPPKDNSATHRPLPLYNAAAMR